VTGAFPDAMLASEFFRPLGRDDIHLGLPAALWPRHVKVRFVGLPIRWSHGFQLGGPAPGRPVCYPMGQLSGRETSGHNGSNTCLGWADPERRLVMAYLTNLILPGEEGARHQSEVSDAVLSACPA
jgi:hypothetical protein